MEISKAKNKNPLPPIKYHAGIRLPPDRFCLHSQNYVLKTPNVITNKAEIKLLNHILINFIILDTSRITIIW